MTAIMSVESGIFYFSACFFFNLATTSRCCINCYLCLKVSRGSTVSSVVPGPCTAPAMSSNTCERRLTPRAAHKNKHKNNLLADDEVDDGKTLFRVPFASSRLRRLSFAARSFSATNPIVVVLSVCLFIFSILVTNFSDDRSSAALGSTTNPPASSLMVTRRAIEHPIIKPKKITADKKLAAAMATTTTTTKNEEPPLKEISLENVLWSRNWYNYAECPDVPHEYYSLANVRSWCSRQYATECIHKADDITKWFRSCNGTIWIRQQSHKGEGDLVTFITHVLPLIEQPFDLITSDGDNSHPHDAMHYEQLVSNPHLKTWYTQNYMYRDDDTQSEKIQPIPIGLDLHTLDAFGGLTAPQVLEKMISIRETGIQNHASRSQALYIPPMSSSNGNRFRAQQAASSCLRPAAERGRLSPLELFQKYTEYRFGLSPPGNGIDCHRTWEMLFFGIIPIVESSRMDMLYHKFDLPVVIVKDWNDLCREGFLDEQYERFKDKIPVANEKLTTGYYIGRCPECKTQIIQPLTGTVGVDVKKI